MAADEFVDEQVNPKEKGNSGENGDGDERPLASVVIDLRDQIARRDIERDTTRERQGIRDRRLEGRANDREHEYTRERRASDRSGRDHHFTKALTRRQQHRRNRKSFRKLVKKDCNKHEEPDAYVYLGRSRDRYAVEERVNK